MQGYNELKGIVGINGTWGSLTELDHLLLVFNTTLIAADGHSRFAIIDIFIHAGCCFSRPVAGTILTLCAGRVLCL